MQDGQEFLPFIIYIASICFIWSIWFVLLRDPGKPIIQREQL
jgi:hypothetical protein